MQELAEAIKAAAKMLFDTDIEPQIDRPDEKFGDFATNAALQLAKKASKTPHEIARALVEELKAQPYLIEVTIAGPGFINFRLTDEALVTAALTAVKSPVPYAGQEILVEFGDPNPFKEMHIGHLYSYIVGDAISSLLQRAGADVKRLSYHGDVGLHVAKAIWGMQQNPEASVGQSYALGAQAYSENDQAKQQIDDINEHVYKQDQEEINSLYEKGRTASFEQFDKILNMLSISTDKRYLESQSAQKGTELVKQNTGKVFKESDGAVIYEGEKAGLHTRVFLTSRGLPTYEAKDLGLAELKNQDYPQAARSVIITANEQSEYFKVMLAALAEINSGLAQKTTHLAHGFVNLSTGKMSSRTGDVYAAQDLINEVETTAAAQFPESDKNNKTALAALKYDFLKPRLGGDITFDVEESVSLEGNSGPYLQYAHARVCSILSKAGEITEQKIGSLDAAERSLALKISEYPEAIQKAVNELMPHHVCTYLYELAQAFNSFYETSRVIGDERQAVRIQLVKAYQQVLNSGLGVLNIVAPERM